jgi:hypothetical protein
MTILIVRAVEAMKTTATMVFQQRGQLSLRTTTQQQRETALSGIISWRVEWVSGMLISLHGFHVSGRK